jgi:general secretion pathway protein I
MIISTHSRSPRAGLSLLEVLVALAILLFSIVALNQALNIGTSNAVDMQQHMQASQLVQSKMAEVYCGAVPLTSVADTPFDEDPDYTWSLDAEQNSVANLWNVTVTVTRTRGDGSKLETKLSQMILDPSIRGTSLDSAYTATLSPPSSTSSGSSGSSSGGSSSSGASASASAAAPITAGYGGAATTAKGSTAKGSTAPSTTPSTKGSTAPSGKGGK